MSMKLVKIEEFAEQVGVTVPTARYWLHTGYAPPHAKLGKRIVFDQVQVDRWLQEKFDAAAADAAARKGVDTEPVPEAAPAVKIQKVNRSSKRNSGAPAGTSRKGA